jgi:Lrp/AsnC family leucine-responsive transcriptional regulator
MTKRGLDNKDWRLLALLQQDARAPLKTLAAAIELSVAATAERIKRLEADGVIIAYRTEIDPTAAGYPVMALVAVTAVQPYKDDLLSTMARMPEVLECHHVTGADSYMVTMVATSIRHLEQLIGGINGYGETRTSIVMSSPIPRRAPRAALE